MLFVLCLQVGTGLFADDDISETGPFGQFVSKPVRKYLTGLHQRNFNIIEALVALHVTAIAAYWLLRRRNLLSPMLTGVARLPAGIAPPRLRGLLLAGAIFAVAACVAAWVASFQDASG
jgi:cytochrome b